MMINVYSDFFTDDDLQRALNDMKSAYALYIEKKKSYDYSVSQGNHRFARKNRKPEMDAAYEMYLRAREDYITMLATIEDEAQYAHNAEMRKYSAESMSNQDESLQAASIFNLKSNTAYLVIGIIAIIIIYKIL